MSSDAKAVPVEEIEARLARLIAQAASQDVRIDDIRPDVALVRGGLALDSVAVLQLLVGIEEEFGILIDDSTLSVTPFESVRSLALFVDARLRERGQNAHQSA